MTTIATHTSIPESTDTGLYARFTAARPSVAERLAAGKALRQTLARRQHGVFALPITRQDPVAILEAQARTRLPELVPIRYARMLTSPFAFLRGAAAVLAQVYQRAAYARRIDYTLPVPPPPLRPAIQRWLDAHLTPPPASTNQ